MKEIIEGQQNHHKHHRRHVALRLLYVRAMIAMARSPAEKSTAAGTMSNTTTTSDMGLTLN